MESLSGGELTLGGHLKELRSRLIVSLAAVAVASVFCYAFIEPIFAVFSMPLKKVLPEGASLIFTSYPEAFFVYLKLSIVCGIFVASPVVLYEIWAFVTPGLYAQERRIACLLAGFSSFFFVAGGIFGYFVVFPAAFRFLAGYAGEDLRLLPGVSEYFTLVIRLLLGFGFAFELPVVLTLLGWLGMIDAGMMRRNRRYAVLLVFLVAAVVTPTPDILNQALLAIPMLLLYEGSIVSVRLVGSGAGSPGVRTP